MIVLYLIVFLCKKSDNLLITSQKIQQWEKETQKSEKICNSKKKNCQEPELCQTVIKAKYFQLKNDPIFELFRKYQPIIMSNLQHLGIKLTNGKKMSHP